MQRGCHIGRWVGHIHPSPRRCVANRWLTSSLAGVTLSPQPVVHTQHPLGVLVWMAKPPRVVWRLIAALRSLPPQRRPGLHNGFAVATGTRNPPSKGIPACPDLLDRQYGNRHPPRTCALTSGSISFPTAKSIAMWCCAQMARWALMGRSEQLPIQHPCCWTRFTMAMVSTPGGSPTSKVPSISKLIRITMSRAFLRMGAPCRRCRTRCRTPRGDCSHRGGQSVPQDLIRGGAPHGKVAAQRHGTARDRDLRRDPGDLSRPARPCNCWMQSVCIQKRLRPLPMFPPLGDTGFGPAILISVW